MNAVLAEMKPEELRDALWILQVCERGGGTSAEEAAEWRRRIVAWQAFLVLDGRVEGA
jgi:hypothetical protein